MYGFETASYSTAKQVCLTNYNASFNSSNEIPNAFLIRITYGYV